MLSLPSQQVTCLGVTSRELRPFSVSLAAVFSHSNLWLADVSIPTSFPPHWVSDLCQDKQKNHSGSAVTFQNKSPTMTGV